MKTQCSLFRQTVISQTPSKNQQIAPRVVSGIFPFRRRDCSGMANSKICASFGVAPGAGKIIIQPARTIPFGVAPGTGHVSSCSGGPKSSSVYEPETEHLQHGQIARINHVPLRREHILIKRNALTTCASLVISHGRAIAETVAKTMQIRHPTIICLVFLDDGKI